MRRGMNLPETIWWCEKHEWPALMSTYCGRPNPQMCRMIPLPVAGSDDLVIRREGMVERALAAYRNPHTQMVKRRAATPEDRMEAALLAAAEGGEE